MRTPPASPLLINLLLAYTLSPSQAAENIETLIVSAERRAAPLHTSALAINHQSRKDLDAIGALHANEIFLHIPNTWISRGSGQEQLTAIRSPVFSGPGACANFLMAADSIPLRASGFCNINQLFDGFIETASAIESFRGPNSASFGSNALFGGINILSPEFKPSSSLQLETDTQAMLRSNWDIGTESQRVFGSLSRIEGERAYEGYSQQKLGYKNRLALGNWNNTNLVEINKLEQETAGFIEGANAYKDSKLRRQNLNPEAYRDLYAMRAQSRWQRQFNEQTELEITPYLRHNKMQFLMHFLPWQPTEENGHSSFGLQNRWRHHINQRLSLNLGLDAEYTQGWLKEYQLQPAPFAAARTPMGDHYDYAVNSTNTAAYAGANLQLSDSVRLDSSWRYDRINYSYNNHLAQGYACAPGVNACRFYRPASRTDYFADHSYRLAAHWQSGAQLNIYLNHSRSFAAPQTTELYRLQTAQEQTITGNVNLSGQELGMRWQGDKLYIELAIFNMQLSDGIYQNTESLYLRGANSSHRGLEYQLDYQASAKLRLKLQGQYSQHKYANALFQRDLSADINGNDIDTAPRTSGRLSLQWQASERLTTDMGYSYLGRYFVNPENTASYGGHGLLDLSAAWSIQTDWLLRLQIKNATNIRYAERADIAFSNWRYLPGLERRAQLSSEFRF